MLIFLYLGNSAKAQQIQVSGNLKNLGNAELRIRYNLSTEPKDDTVKAVNGKFTWTAPMSEAQRVVIFFSKRTLELYKESHNITITGSADSLDKVTITGSQAQLDANTYHWLIKPLDDSAALLYDKYKKVSKEEQVVLEEKLEMIRSEKRVMAKQFIRAHPESFFSLSMVSSFAYSEDYRDLFSLYEALGQSIKASKEGKRFAERLAILKHRSIGEQILDFTQNDVNGKPVSFSAFKGKYVLVDFWASWCAPCRAENPNVLKAYNTYKDKNFTVVGISLDTKSENWKKAIKDDGMPWTELSDLKGWKNELATYYGIQGIPSTLLIDPKGKIIAINLRGATLNKKLAELFN